MVATVATPELLDRVDLLAPDSVLPVCRAPWVLMRVVAMAALVAPAGIQRALELAAVSVVLEVRAETHRLAELLVTEVRAAQAALAIAEPMPQLVSLRRPVLVVELVELADLVALWPAQAVPLVTAELADSAEPGALAERDLQLETIHLAQLVEMLAQVAQEAQEALLARSRDQFLATAATAATPELLAKPVLQLAVAMVAQVAMVPPVAQVVPVAQQMALAQQVVLVETEATPATELPVRTPELSL